MNIGTFKLYFTILHTIKYNFLFDYLFTSYWGSKYWQYLWLDCVEYHLQDCFASLSFRYSGYAEKKKKCPIHIGTYSKMWYPTNLKICLIYLLKQPSKFIIRGSFKKSLPHNSEIAVWTAKKENEILSEEFWKYYFLKQLVRSLKHLSQSLTTMIIPSSKSNVHSFLNHWRALSASLHQFENFWWPKNGFLSWRSTVALQAFDVTTGTNKPLFSIKITLQNSNTHGFLFIFNNNNSIFALNHKGCHINFEPDCIAWHGAIWRTYKVHIRVEWFKMSQKSTERALCGE